MKPDERIADYLDGLNGLVAAETPRIRAVREEAERLSIPAIRAETAGLLRFLTALAGPSRILEIGTGNGLSALWMNLAAPRAEIVTLERDRKRFELASRNLAHLSGVSVVYADAFDWIAGNAGGRFGLVFLDAQKRDYARFLEVLPDLIEPGGLLVADNVLFGGRAASDGAELEEKYRGGVALLKHFNEAFARDERFAARFFADGDGLAAGVKK